MTCSKMLICSNRLFYKCHLWYHKFCWYSKQLFQWLFFRICNSRVVCCILYQELKNLVCHNHCWLSSAVFFLSLFY